MTSATRRVLGSLTRAASSRGTLIHHATLSARVNSVRSLTASFQRLARPTQPQDDNEEVNNEPIKFSTSKGSHRIWKVDRSLGSQFERPWWKVFPISLLTIGFLLWCALREETDIDVQLEKQLYEQLPGLLSDEADEQVQNKSS